MGVRPCATALAPLRWLRRDAVVVSATVWLSDSLCLHTDVVTSSCHAAVVRLRAN